MNKRLTLQGLILTCVALTAHACPIRVKNDTNLSVYVITPAIAQNISDVATGKQIKQAADKIEMSKNGYEKVRVNETDMVGNGGSKTYYVYVKAGRSKQYIRLYQIQLTSCIPTKQKKRWWRRNTIAISQLKNGQLTEQQEKHLKLIDLRKLFGYKFTRAYQELQSQLFRFWNEQAPENEPMIEDIGQ